MGKDTFKSCISFSSCLDDSCRRFTDGL